MVIKSNIVTYIYLKHGWNNKHYLLLGEIGEEEIASDADSSVKMKIKLKGRKVESRGSSRRKRSRKYVSDEEEEEEPIAGNWNIIK